jgi:vitamin B12 transporter
MDLGIEQRLFNDRLQLNAGYFWNRFQNMIQFASGGPLCPPGSFGFCPINVADAKTQGWEFAFKLIVLKGLEVRGQYTHTLTRAFDSPTLRLGGDKRLARWPVDQATVGFTYAPIEALRLNIDYRFVGARNNNLANSSSQKLGVFNVVNLSASYDVTKNWQAYVRVDNLFDEKYEEITFFGTPTRSVFGGVRMNYDIPL